MALDVRIISNGATYYLTNSSGAPTRGGAPTGASTTPYSLEAQDWTLTVAPRQTIYSGGPPFRIGRSPLYSGYDTVTETIGVGIAGSSADNTIALIQTLRRALTTQYYSGGPPILAWKPHGATNFVYYEIYSADVQEVGDWTNPAAGFLDPLVKVTWTRSPVGSWYNATVGAGAETVINAATMTNRPSVTNPNIATMGSGGSGDLIYDGQPLNIQMSNLVWSAGRTGPTRVMLATAAQSSAFGSTLSGTTINTTTGVLLNAGSMSFTPAAPIRTRIRCIIHTSSANADSQVRIELRNMDSSVFGPWVTLSAVAGQHLWDLGGLDVSTLMRGARNTHTSTVEAYLWLRAITGTGASVVVYDVEFIEYYTFCEAQYPGANVNTDHELHYQIDSFPEAAGRVSLPHPVPLAITTYVFPSGPQYQLMNVGTLRGTPPRYYAGASIWVAWTADIYVNTATIAMTARQAPLYLSLRGNT